MSQDYQTRQLNTEEGNLSGPIRTSHNSHIHIDNTRQPEPQLKRCHSKVQLKECHMLNPYLEPRLKGYVSSHNSRNTSKLTFEISPKLCRPRTSTSIKTQLLPLQYRLVLSLVTKRNMLPDRLAGDTCR